MRVITGKYRGRVLHGPKHQGLRPTADRVKEALFNILGERIADAAFLDLFAGTGGIGIEALSRGAGSVVFVDLNPSSIRLLKQNLHFVSPQDQVRVVHLAAAKAVDLFAREKAAFDIVFLDPPFEAGLLDRTVTALWEGRLLKPGGVLVAEHPRKYPVPRLISMKAQTRNYGDISLTFYTFNQEQEDGQAKYDESKDQGNLPGEF
jgi:16S rRNA (guanine966-N2)-methyltransferase